jgi:chromosome segregation ATPase
VETQGRAHAQFFVELHSLQKARAQLSGECSSWKEKGREIHADLILLQEQDRQRTRERGELRQQCKERKQAAQRLEAEVDKLRGEVRVALVAEADLQVLVEQLEASKSSAQARHLQSDKELLSLRAAHTQVDHDLGLAAKQAETLAARRSELRVVVSEGRT